MRVTKKDYHPHKTAEQFSADCEGNSIDKSTLRYLIMTDKRWQIV